MSRICQITGSRPRLGHRICRRGLPKKKGGIGTHVTANTRRFFFPNLKYKKIYVPELGEFVKVRATTRALKTINKNGAYKTLLKAGLIRPKNTPSQA